MKDVKSSLISRYLYTRPHVYVCLIFKCQNNDTRTLRILYPENMIFKIQILFHLMRQSTSWLIDKQTVTERGYSREKRIQTYTPSGWVYSVLAHVLHSSHFGVYVHTILLSAIHCVVRLSTLCCADAGAPKNKKKKIRGCVWQMELRVSCTLPAVERRRKKKK